MNESKISVRYARALFDLSGEKKIQGQVYQDMGQVYRSMKANADLGQALDSPVIPVSRKMNLIREIYRGRVQELTLTFLELMVKHRRESYIPMVALRFLSLYKQEQGITELTLTTASPFPEESKEKIRKLVAGAYTSKIELREIHKPEIIGGFILRVNDEQLDASVASELKRIRRILITGQEK